MKSLILSFVAGMFLAISTPTVADGFADLGDALAEDAIVESNAFLDAHCRQLLASEFRATVVTAKRMGITGDRRGMQAKGTVAFEDGSSGTFNCVAQGVNYVLDKPALSVRVNEMPFKRVEFTHPNAWISIKGVGAAGPGSPGQFTVDFNGRRNSVKGELAYREPVKAVEVPKTGSRSTYTPSYVSSAGVYHRGYTTYVPSFPIHIEKSHGERYFPEDSITTTHDDNYRVYGSGDSRPFMTYTEKGRDHHTRNLP